MYRRERSTIPVPTTQSHWQQRQALLPLATTPSTRSQQPQALLPPPSLNPAFMMQQLLPVPVPVPVGLHWQTNTMGTMPRPWCAEGGAPLAFYDLPFCGDPHWQAASYQGMAQPQYRVQALNPAGLSHWHQGFNTTEAQYSYHYVHESSETVAEDRFRGIHPGRARMGASYETGTGKVWRTPSKDPLIAD
jgi:hypothetical protein